MAKSRKQSDQQDLFPLRRTQAIYCGDNLQQLPNIPNESVDLIYIDPPFNSNQDYEVFWGEAKETRAFVDRHASTQSYIDYMRPRCDQLARVLKKTGSFYYHCDWHASHYVKVMLDQILGEDRFRNEIVWRRSDAHNDARKQFAVVSDSIFFYTGSDEYTFNVQYGEFAKQTLLDWYQYLELPDGMTRRMTAEEKRTQVIPIGARRFNTDNLRSPHPRPNLTYDYKGFKPHVNGWAISLEKMKELDAKGLLIFPKSPDGRIMRKKYLDESKGTVLGNVWNDISQLHGANSERLGYPTQKPLALLERIVKSSSNKGDLVLDAFCGCGTALIAAENLDRQWIGIDISPTACRVVGERLAKVCKLREGIDFAIRGLPREEAELRAMPPFEFENWAVIALGGNPNRAHVGDMGIDGKIFPVASAPTAGKQPGELGFMDIWYPVQVKQRDKAGRPDIDAFETAMERANRTKGFFVSFGFTSDATTEIQRFFTKTGKIIIPLTVREILDDQIAMKLA